MKVIPPAVHELALAELVDRRKKCSRRNVEAIIREAEKGKKISYRLKKIRELLGPIQMPIVQVTPADKRRLEEKFRVRQRA